MQIITDNSEQSLIEMLPVIEENPQLWMSVHVNISPIHNILLKEEGLSSDSLGKIREVSLKLANKLAELRLGEFEGKIMVFEDTDILALFLKKPEMIKPVLEKIRGEFSKSGLLHILKVEEMKEKLANLVTLSEEKKQTAKDHHMKQLMVKTGENTSEWSPPDQKVTAYIQKKRSIRKSSCVLVIEDDVLMRGLLVNMLKHEHQVIQAKNGTSGIINYIEYAPNVVLLDINMPGLNGHEALKRLKQIDQESYIVMLSGASTQSNVVSSHYSGAAGFLRKPFSKGKLYEYIRQCPSLQAK